MNIASARNAKTQALRLCLALVLLLGAICCASAAERRILVYTKNGKGYVHDNIPASVAALKKLGAENDFLVDVSDDPAVLDRKSVV